MSQVASSSASSFGCRSTTHRVLAIPELLQIIFSFGTRSSNASNALVCRGWREPALDNVWREVDDIYYLLQLLAPFNRRSRMDFYVRGPFVAVGRGLLKHRYPSRSFPASRPPKIGRVSSLTLAVCVLSSTGPTSPRKPRASETASLMTWLARALPWRFSQISDPFGGIQSQEHDTRPSSCTTKLRNSHSKFTPRICRH
jgi:F-box-like